MDHVAFVCLVTMVMLANFYALLVTRDHVIKYMATVPLDVMQACSWTDVMQLVLKTVITHGNLQSGTCSSGCKNEYFGNNCEAACSIHCTIYCDQENGRCSKGCLEGYFGETCEQSCPENCAEDECSQADGSCSVGCRDGWMGERCAEGKYASYVYLRS